MYITGSRLDEVGPTPSPAYTLNSTMTVPIPNPPAVPFLGHINAIDKNVPTKSLSLLAQQYGEIYQLSILGMSFMCLYKRRRD